MKKIGTITIGDLYYEDDVRKALDDNGFQICLERGTTFEKSFILMRKNNEKQR